jgi:hypothetical protein
MRRGPDQNSRFEERLRESVEVARAMTPRGLIIFVVGRSPQGRPALYSKSFAALSRVP